MLILSLTSHATTQYWDGSTDGDGDGIHWSDPENWVCDCVPAAADYVRIDNATALVLNGSIVVDVNTTIDAPATYGELYVPAGFNITMQRYLHFTKGCKLYITTGAPFRGKYHKIL